MSKSKQQKQAKPAASEVSTPAAEAKPHTPAAGAKRRSKQQQQYSALGFKALALAVAVALIGLYTNMVAPGLLPVVKRALPWLKSARGEHTILFEPGVTKGGVTMGPSFGIYPRGCRWREVSYNNGSQEVSRGLGGVGHAQRGIVWRLRCGCMGGCWGHACVCMGGGWLLHAS